MSYKTPRNVVINKRIPSIVFQDAEDWHPSREGTQLLLDTLSCHLPTGEVFFINSVRSFRDSIQNSQVLEDIKKFIYQEAMHARYHSLANKGLEKINRFSKPSEHSASFLLFLASKFTSRYFCLAITCAVEHFTATIAEDLLKNYDRFSVDVKHPYSFLWIWHSIEEIEHKSVAFDVFEAIKKNKLWRYFIRVGAMIVVCFSLLLSLTINMPLVLIGKKITQKKNNKFRDETNNNEVFSNSNPLAFNQKKFHVSFQTKNFTVEQFRIAKRKKAYYPSKKSKPERGIYQIFSTFKCFLLPLLSYFKPKFHPWNHDNSAMLNNVTIKFEEKYSAFFKKI